LFTYQKKKLSSFCLLCIGQVNLSIAIIPMSHQFGWNSSTAGLVQSSFFWGYALSQLPGGWLAKVFGGRSVSNLFLISTRISLKANEHTQVQRKYT
jgi:ACS family sodium-dependent inorganic phosphate cotransporter